ncbi:hypothetical protein [uncultured Psychrosphaera sp.]|uniref:hypothetical protein n=1 Tax=uncultured Psychrosphaera sp. TaxID=1403522 RepID=UPI00262226E6|nr:hypothetical protein [uncultured Psychrosphaera sp.]
MTVMLAKTPKILTVLTFIFAWLPAFILAVICCSMIIGASYSIIYGISSGSYSDTYDQSILSLLLGILMWVFGLFGFVGLSSVVIGPQLKLVTRITFLFLGIVSVISQAIYWGAEEPIIFSHPYQMYTAIFYSCLFVIVVFAVIHIVINYRLIKHFIAVNSEVTE